MEVLECIKMFSDMGLNSTGGLSNNSNGMPKNIRPIMDSALVAMAMMQGLTSAIVNPNDLRLMETIKSCDVFKGNTLYADSYLELYSLNLAGFPLMVPQRLRKPEAPSGVFLSKSGKIKKAENIYDWGIYRLWQK